MSSNQIAVLASLMLVLTTAAAADRSDPVVVTNGANAPIPVSVTNLPGITQPAPKTMFSDVSGGATVTVVPAPGAGKRFVVKHIAMFVSSNISGVPLVDANCLLSMHQGSLSFAIETFSLQRADVVGALGLSRSDYLVLGPADSLDMLCMTSPGNSGGRVTISGDVLTGP